MSKLSKILNVHFKSAIFILVCFGCFGLYGQFFNSEDNLEMEEKSCFQKVIGSENLTERSDNRKKET